MTFYPNETKQTLVNTFPAKLVRAFFLMCTLYLAASGETDLIETAAKVRLLSVEEASQAPEVRLRGVFMANADPMGIAFILQDETEAIYVQAPAEQLKGIKRGDLIEMEGVANPGGFAPIVFARSLRKIGEGEIPEAKKVTLDQLYTGQMDAYWIEISGVVRSAEPKVSTDSSPPPPGTRYEVPDLVNEHYPVNERQVKIKLASGLARVMVGVERSLDPEKYVDAEVTVRAICYNLHNRSRQYVKPFVQIPLGEKIQIDVPPPDSPFDGDVSSIGSLLQFGRENDSNGHRVHIQGVVLHHRSGVGLWVRDDTDCILVESAQVGQLNPGDIVDVLGFPVPGEYTPILEDAVYRKLPGLTIPEPLSVTDITEVLENDANLVELQTEFIVIREFPEEGELTMNWNGKTIRAHMDNQKGGAYPVSWTPGSHIQLTGVCEVLADAPGPLGGLWIPTSFQLLLRSPNDLVVLKPPPWWNAERIAWVLLGFLFLALATIAIVLWVARIRMKQQEQRRAMAEAEFSAILNERNRVAREIHDTLSQSLGSISLQLELARTHAEELNSEVRNHMGTAHQLTRDALKEARNSIWNIRSHVLENGDLVDALQRILKQLTEGFKIRTDVAVEGRRRRLSPMLENDLLRVGQEAIANSCKHGNPKSIWVKLIFDEREIQLFVKDDGIGFDPNKYGNSKRRSFGLVGIQERIELLGGTVSIKSSSSIGTEIQVKVRV